MRRPPNYPAALRDLARVVRRLRPDWNNPERFFENRGEIEDQLRRLAREMEGK